MKPRTLLSIVASLAVAVAALSLAPVDAEARVLPDGERAPVVWVAAIERPQAHNRLLEVDLTVDATDDDDIAAYEYRWNRGTIGSVKSTPSDEPVVSFASTTPQTRYVLQVRAVDTNGWRSEWVLAADIVTPPPPTVIIAGDSVASGYHRQWFSSKGQCLDRDYSYGSTVHMMIAEALPVAWAPQYRNVAWAGAGLASMTNGGTDSCGDHHESQVEAIANAANPETWNIVIATGGINSTNWSGVVAELTKDTAFSFSERGDQEACAAAVSDKWNLGERTSTVSTGARTFAESVADRTNARLFWTSYYSIIGSKLAPGWTPIGSECTDEMRTAMDLLHGTLRSGLGARAEWIDLDQDSLPTQDWGGWPHPNAEGQATLGSVIGADVLARVGS